MTNLPQLNVRRFSQLFAFAALAVVVFGSSGCASETFTRFDQRHSANLLLVEPEFPGDDPEDLLDARELDVYREYGRPDVIRLLFNPAGDVYRHEQARHEFYSRGNSHEGVDRAWIYRARGIEVRITRLGVETRELSPKIETLIQFGDPQNVINMGPGREKWVYYDFGRRFVFDGEELVGEEHFPAMGMRRDRG